ncbi:MAG: DUF1761 domain-containing protein [Acidobacteria bacterium]|nr:DUF1761 domain-containing protein [Acidobacteriota bacterium]
MATFFQVNYVAVFVAAVAGLIVGMLWYLPMTFGAHWASLVRRYTGLSDEDLRPDPPRHLSMWFVGAILNAAVLAALARGVGADTAPQGAMLGIAAWIGFGATFSSWPVIFARQPWDLWAVNNGAFLLMQAVMGAVVAAWH